MDMKVISVAVALAAAVGFGADQGATAPEFIWRDVKGVRWSFHGNARIVGDELVCVADATNRNAFAIGYCDLSEYDGKPLQMQIVASAEDVTRSRKSYLGFRFMLSYLDLDMGGNRVWPNGGALYGTKPPTEIAWRDINGKRRGKCEIQLGLHDCTGRAVYNLKTLQARATSPLVPKINEGYKVKYPDRVRNAPRGRGVMLGGMDDAAWDTLRSWGANLVRHQISLGGTGPATNHEAYVAGYLRNYDRCLDELEKRLVAARKRGIRVCIDQHSSPGGRCDAGDPAEWRGDCRMFHDPVYAQLFIDCWVKLARRMAPYRDAIYGYDLINEACHNAPALPDGDIVNLQRRCAEAIRAVDPDTTIILESMYCDPAWFARMSAIRMDNVIYQVHLYYPHDYTHQGILNPVDHLEYWPDPKKGWNRDFLRRSLKPVIDFQREHDAKMFVGEFSVAAWAPNAEEYMRDCMAIFEELGWDWTFHAFREFQGWSVECESTSRGMGSEHFRKSASNPRMRTLKEGLKGGFLPGKPGVGYKSRAFRRVMISGNSITRHGPAPKIGWTNDWGMAASRPEKDYVHLFLRGLECHGGVKPEYRQIHVPLENGTADTAEMDRICAGCTAWKPDLVVFAHGENAHALTNDANWAICKASYLQATRAFMAAGATVVLRAPYWPNGRYAGMLKDVADETGAIWVDIGDLGWKKGMSATGLFKHGGVAMHPGDNGMIAIADRLLAAVYERQMADEAARRPAGGSDYRADMETVVGATEKTVAEGLVYPVEYRPGKSLTGNLADWDDVTAEGRLETPMRVSVYPRPADLRPTFKCCVSDRALYFLLKADDAVPAFAVTEGACYLNDCFELYLDPLFRRSMALDDTMSQTSVTPKDRAYTDVKVAGHLEMRAKKVPYAGGWAAELEIPLVNGCFEMTPYDGLKFGCNVAYSDNDHPPKATVDHKLGWCRLDDTDCSWQTPGVFGAFVIRGTGRTAAVPVKEGAQAAANRARRQEGESCEDAKLLGSFRPSPAVSRGFNCGGSDKAIADACAWGANNIRYEILYHGERWGTLSPDEVIAKASRRTREVLESCRRHGAKLVMDFRGFRNRERADASMPWRYTDDYIRFILAVLRECEGLHESIWAVDIFNEPLDFAQLPYPPIELRAFYLRVTRAIHARYPDLWCIYEVGPGGGYFGFTDLKPIPDPKVIYSLHFYNPGAFTHQGVDAALLQDASLTKEQKGNMKRYPGFYLGRWFDRDEIVRQLANVRKFQLKYDVPIYVGEFSCVSWAPVECTTQYLQDLVDVFEKYGWSWSYHCFRGWPGWNLDTEDGVLVRPKTGVETRRAPIIRKALERNGK